MSTRFCPRSSSRTAPRTRSPELARARVVDSLLVLWWVVPGLVDCRQVTAREVDGEVSDGGGRGRGRRRGGAARGGGGGVGARARGLGCGSCKSVDCVVLFFFRLK